MASGLGLAPRCMGGLGFRGLGFRGLGVWGLGFRGLGFRGLGEAEPGCQSDGGHKSPGGWQVQR